MKTHARIRRLDESPAHDHRRIGWHPYSARQAVAFGYAGTSHKNCKGIIKGIANACMLEHRRRRDRSRPYILSAEDLTNIGPVALSRICASWPTSAFPTRAQWPALFQGPEHVSEKRGDAVLAAHPNLYHRHPRIRRPGYQPRRRQRPAASSTRPSASAPVSTWSNSRRQINGRTNR